VFRPQPKTATTTNTSKQARTLHKTFMSGHVLLCWIESLTENLVSSPYVITKSVNANSVLLLIYRVVHRLASEATLTNVSDRK